MRSVRRLVLAVVVAACGGHVSPPPAPDPSVVPFSWIDNRVFVDATIDGRGPFHLLLDTGAEASITPATARTLGLAVGAGERESGVGSATVATGTTSLHELRVGPAVLDDLSVHVLPLDGLENMFGTARIDGILGLPLFERYAVTHDFIHHVLRIVPSRADAPPPPLPHGAVALPFERPAQIPVIAATLDGVAGKFGVDTGARSALLVFGPFAATNHLADKYGAHLQGVTGWGIGGPVRSLLARAHELRLGDVAAVHDLVIRLSTQTAGATTGTDMAGLIGPDVLAQFDVTFDYPHARIVLARNAQYGRADAYDRAGVWMGQGDRVFVALDVIAGGPADAAGLHAGERILSIDGVATSALVLPEVRERMRRTAVGTPVHLVVESAAGARRDVVVTLRDLV